MPVDSVWLQQKFPDVNGLNEIGRGGQKKVFAGTHPADGAVVVKIFTATAVEDRGVREVQAVKNIQSQRIPKVFEIGKVLGPIGEMIWVREQRIPADNLRVKMQSAGDHPVWSVLTG